MNKQFRQNQILKLAGRKKIHTQDELARELAAVGIQATQVTLSRDIKELRLAKTAEGYAPVSAPAVAGPAFAIVAAEFLREVRSAQNLVVLKTSPGNANTLAVALDREEWSGVVGTVAGDDTLLIVTPDNSTAGKLRAKLLALVR